VQPVAANGCEPLPAVTPQTALVAYQQSSEMASASQPLLDPNQIGNLRGRVNQSEGLGPAAASGGSPVLDPNQIGNLGNRLGAVEQRLQDAGKPSLPLIRLSGFAQLDEGLASQSNASLGRIGNIQNGVGFRRTRLQAIGKLTEHTGLSIEMDFATVGRPSFQDVWGEQNEIPFFGTVRIGQFRQPETMDNWTSIRHLEFLERSLPFQAQDPFRRVGIMAYAMTEDERTQWAYSIYGTGLTFFNGVDTTYTTVGDNRFGTQIGDSGGVSGTIRASHLLYYDEPSDGRYLIHIGGGYNFSELGGNRNATGPFAKAYNSRPIPEFFVGDLSGNFTTVAGTPAVVDTGRIAATSSNFWHTEFAGNWGAAHFQTEFLATSLNQRGGPAIFYPGAYFQCGYFLTGESCLYLKQAGVLDYNVVPYSDFFGLGRKRGFGGWGAWECAFRWSWQDLSGVNINPANQLSNAAGPPPAPNPGVVNQTTLAVNWWWNKFTRLQFNWIHSMPTYRGYGFAPFDLCTARFQVEF
jgi:phosphate-selective porin OprO/OprP